MCEYTLATNRQIFMYCVLKLHTVINTLRWAVVAVLWIGFCLTGPISLCVDLFVFVCTFCFILHSCCIIVSTVRWTWWDWSLILWTYQCFDTVVWVIFKNLSPIWPMCWRDIPYSPLLWGLRFLTHTAYTCVVLYGF